MKGTYILILKLESVLPELQVGRLGSFTFAPGYYLYVGSALGFGGLAARLRHHVRRDKPRCHWHIDYLRPHARLIESWSVATPERLECHWCRVLQASPELSLPIPRFGASDLTCAGHLFFTPRRPSPRLLVHAIFETLPSLSTSEVLLDINTYDEPVA